jgi:hypothetical protein
LEALLIELLGVAVNRKLGNSYEDFDIDIVWHYRRPEVMVMILMNVNSGSRVKSGQVTDLRQLRRTVLLRK